MGENEQSFRRHVAYKIRIDDINKGKYVKNEGSEPNYIFTKHGNKVSRINVIGIIVTINQEPTVNLSIEDASGRINVFSFDDTIDLSSFDIGDMVMLIGRPREYNNQKYVVPEIVRKLDNPSWAQLRKLELEKIYSNMPEKEAEVEEKKESITLPEEDILSVDELEVADESEPKSREEKMDLFEKVYGIIKNNDTGKGVTYEEVIEECGSDSEKAIETLLKRGEVFEIAAGRLKVLE